MQHMKYWLFLVWFCVHISQTHAVTPDSWRETTFSYQEEPRDVGRFFKVFSQALGVRTQINYPALQNKILSGGQHLTGNAVQVLDRLATMYSFQWYVYRNILYISDYQSDRTEYIPLKGVTPAQAKQAMTGAGLFEPKFGWAEFDRGNRSAVLVSGPPSYLALVNGILHRISIDDPDQEERRVLVFPLRYASAIDIEVPARDGTTVRRGVASTLKMLLAPNLGGGIDSSSELGGLRISKSLGSLASVGGKSTSAANTIPSMSNPFEGINPLGPFSAAPREEEQPVIEAYAALNAILIRDKPSKKPMYEQILRTLDVPARRVELVVTIVDVDVNALDEWIPHISIGNKENNISIQPTRRDNANIGNVVLVSSNRFAIALKNSESTGQARIQSRPSIMTLDNLVAILDLSQTAYFKLIGERTADVKSVTVGTRLKVLPRILGYNNDADLHVQLELEDGSLQAPIEGEDVSRSRSSLIATQAIISPGQSLLIGGYRRDVSEKTKSRVPFLSEIPKIGKIFTSETNLTNRVERLFVLSARMVPEPSSSVQEQVEQLGQKLRLQ
jgi:type III secretion protein C